MLDEVLMRVATMTRLEEAEPVLRTQFSYTGSSVQNGMGLIEESRSNFKYFCTGRRFLTRFVADLEVLFWLACD